MKKKLLYLVHRIPYPPNKGDKIRSFNILKCLARHYEIHLATFVDDDDDWQHRPALEAYCADVYAAPLNPAVAKLKSLPALLGSAPLSLPYYRQVGLADWVEAQRMRHEFHAVLVFSSAMAQYVMGERWSGVRRVIDFVDVDSDKWRQYAAAKSWPMNWIYRREGRTLLAYERKVAACFDNSFFVSEQEADLFKSLAPEAAPRVSFVNNGVDTDYFTPQQDYVSPYAEGEQVMVFTGAMDYWANVDAVSWFAEQVLPRVRERHARARFYIVGSRPTRQVQQLADQDGVTVTGAVKDIRPYLAHACIAVAPLRLARGVQNKVLEAMAMARPVVATPQALDGLEAQVGVEVLQADNEAAFVDTLDTLMQQDQADDLGPAARRRVIESYSWQHNLSRLETMLAG
ncbi:sugar transferase [Candidatus Tenderia electrophaga]|uniref:Sugar transferase n=1 Tax=Candidatus Tenderia electrophaga TaxID=1748243 RepID=A0A0S2TG58_9GAMM|nr:sugar transferase [Candidatus Tenderia electrophaga]